SNVYCEIHPFHKLPPLTPDVKGVILYGSPYSVNNPEGPKPVLSVYRKHIPVLAVCYGAQYLVYTEGGEVASAAHREYGRSQLTYMDRACPIFAEVPDNSQVWMSHGDTITRMPDGFGLICSTPTVEAAGYKIEGEETYALQFHPEVYHSTDGVRMLGNFLRTVCGFTGDFTPEHFVESIIPTLREQIGDGKVILGLSGGVDSTVAAVLLHKAIGNRLYGIFIDNGLLRKNEYQEVLASFAGMGLQVKGVDASRTFYAALKDITDPEAKRKAIGKTFIEVFEREAKAIEGATFLAQGTIYPDVIESVSVKGPSMTIKSHHNVGGLPEKMNLKIVEPLRTLFKDEVRRVGKSLGIDPMLLGRHPFPGPGLAIRILGDVTAEKVALLQEADAIFINALRSLSLYD
ncbi:MAG: glutamine-hydrolyzing GMP synthase, partial [Bacteroidales bacterium]|nr:glutamine-hydrolyzing GMP synthase [Bacteroidales bacterium]